MVFDEFEWADLQNDELAMNKWAGLQHTEENDRFDLVNEFEVFE